MHTLTITTKYKFGDEVRFDSINGKGTGKVFGIMVDQDKLISYLIEIDRGGYSDLQPGILEGEITGMASALSQLNCRVAQTFLSVPAQAGMPVPPVFLAVTEH